MSDERELTKEEKAKYNKDLKEFKKQNGIINNVTFEEWSK